MSNAWTTLTARFDSLQQVNSVPPQPVVKDNGRNRATINGQHQGQPTCDNPVERTRRATTLKTHRNPASTAPTTSLNNDFSAVAKCIYKMVQVRHYQNNWNVLPPSLSHRINRLADDIRPPMTNDAFTSDLRTLVSDFGDNIRRLVARHLDSIYNNTQQEAGLLDPTDVERATAIANKYINARLGRRLQEARRTTLLREAADLVGILRSPALQQTATDDLHVDGDTWQTVQPRSPRTTRLSTKRMAPGTPESTTTPINNRFQCLETVDASATDDTYARNETTDTTKPHRSLLKKSRKSTISDPSRPFVHAERKENWSIEPAEDTTTIVIGDSNLRRVTSVPRGWEVHVFPGAHLEHVTQVINSIVGEPHSFNVVIHVGINHRKDNFDSSLQDIINDLNIAIHSNEAVGTAYYTAVSIPSTLSAAEKNNLAALNRYMSSNYADLYVEGLSDEDTEVDPSDRHSIHYNDTTVERIFGLIIDHVHRQNFQTGKTY